MVTLLVGIGENPVRFVIHKEFACHYSPVFKAAFNSNFIEGWGKRPWKATLKTGEW
jgi:hypothetical protein